MGVHRAAFRCPVTFTVFFAALGFTAALCLTAFTGTGIRLQNSFRLCGRLIFPAQKFYDLSFSEGADAFKPLRFRQFLELR